MLGGVDDELAALEGDAAEPSGHQVRLPFGGEGEGPQVDVAELETAVDDRRMARQRNWRLADVALGIGVDLLGQPLEVLGAGVRSDDHTCAAVAVAGLHDLPAEPLGSAVDPVAIGLNRCPAAQWNAFNGPALAKEPGDTLVVLNGPRHFLMDSASAVVGGRHTFHGLRMTRVATIAIHRADELVQAPYTDRVVTRTNTWRRNAGRTVYELIAPGGDTYVMQSYAQITDRTRTLGRLSSLGHTLRLPAGWRYRTWTLGRPLVLSATGSATIIQDNLQDTYQLATATRRGKRVRHILSIAGRTHTVVPPATPGTVEDHGTISGTPFGRGTVVVVGTLTDGRLTATFRLTFPRGSVLGTTSMPFTISGQMIHFAGMSRLTGGTGDYRGISAAR